MNERLSTVRSSWGFAKTTERLEAAIDRQGLTILARIDHQALAKAAGEELPPTLLFIFGSAKKWAPALAGSRVVGLDLPARVLVWEDRPGEVWLSYENPETLGARRGLKATLLDDLAATLEDLVHDAVTAAPAAPLLSGAAACHDRGPGRLGIQMSVGGVAFPVDEPIEVGGGATGPAPHDLLAAGLAACTALTLRLYADRKAWPLERVHVAVDHLREEGVQPADLFRRRIELDGPLDETQRARLVEIAQRCPVHRTLTASSRIETEAAAEVEPA
ncbi:MAG: OsmC family protein [Caulobacteraceae bacterium]